MITFEKCVEFCEESPHNENLQAWATLAQALAIKEVANALNRIANVQGKSIWYK